MANDIKCENYTYILNYPTECKPYAIEHKDTICKDSTLKFVFKEVCQEPTQAITTQNTAPTAPKMTIPKEQETSFIILLVLVIFAIIGYVLYIILRPIQDRRKQVGKIRIKFPNPDKRDEEGHIDEMQSFFSSIHNLIKTERISIEIHKAKSKVELMLTYSDIKIKESVKNYLTSIEGVSIEEVNDEDDPLDTYSPFLSKKLVLTKDYYCINTSQTLFFKQLVDYLASLEDKEQAGIIISIRATEKASKIEEELSKRDKKLEKSRLNFERFKNEKENMLNKASNSMFLVDINVFGNSLNTRDGLVSIVTGLNSKNTFSIKNGKTKKELKTRYVPFENLFTPLFRKNFGSFLNAYELALMFHPSKLERGKYETQETVVLEAKPEFVEDMDNNILIGKSILRTGKPVNIYLPLDVLQRHVYLAGSTGMGKSTVLIRLYLSLIEKQPDTSLVLFDPHGEDLLEIAYRIKNWNEVIYFNLAESSKTFTFNPLFCFRKSLKDKDNKVEQIMKILSEEAEKKNKDLGTSIEKLLKFLVQTAVHFPDAYFQYLLKTGIVEIEAEKIVKERQLTFSDLTHILQKDSEYQQVMKTVFEEYDEDIGIKWSLQLENYITNRSVLDGVDNRLGFVLQDSLVDLFEGSSFDINEAIRNHKKVLMPISEQSFGRISKKLVTKFLLNEVWSEAQSITLKEERSEVVIFIDEFQEAQLEIIDDLLAQARKFKIRLVFGNQFLGQLWDNIRKSVLGNVSTLFSFKVQNLDEAETIAPMFKNKIKPEDIVSLPKFNAYLRTLNTSSGDDVAFMSFKTINYTDEIDVFHDYKALLELNEQCLTMYGDEKIKIKNRRLFKIRNPFAYFIDLAKVDKSI